MASSISQKIGISNKHILIDKANTTVVIAASVTTAIVVFSLVGATALVKQMSYQNKVIGLRNKANKQLDANVKAVGPLTTAYQTFENSPESVIGTQDKNSVIVLDALPSKYDFPALATSLEGLIKGSGATITSITGTDNEADAQQDSTDPKPVDMPFQFVAGANLTSAQKLIADIERSIRPMQISDMTLTGSDGALQVSVTAKTYYQPEKKLGIQQTVVTNGKSTTKKTTTTKKVTP